MRPVRDRSRARSLSISYFDTLLDFFHRILLGLDPERAHDSALSALRLAASLPLGKRLLRRRLSAPPSTSLEQSHLGCRFANPIGLAAGFDKNASAVGGLATLGFGFLEVGTVTPKPQPGNPKPRIFRHPEQRALQNALGFNNDGMETIAARLQRARPFPLPVGVNIGKNAKTPLEDAESDYAALFAGFGEIADYFTINVSSPNTSGLRDLQTPKRVGGLLRLGRESTERPILVKLSPDLETGGAVDLAVAAVEAGASGLILTNTTTRYELVPGAESVGGLSGSILRERSLELLRAVSEVLFGQTALVSVGGIESAEDAFERLKAGASLLQIYTGLVYAGPRLVGSLARGLQECLSREGYATLTDAIGADVGKKG